MIWGVSARPASQQFPLHISPRATILGCRHAAVAREASSISVCT